ncbi:MAG: glycosyl hydrolase family 18 protein [Bacteroidota bacterium]
MRNLLLLICFVLLLQSELSAQGFRIIGYLPTYRFSLQNDIHFEQLTHLNLSFLNPDANGNLVIDGQNIDPIVSRARSLNPTIKVFVAIAGGGLTAEWEAAYKLRMQAANRTAFVQQLVAYVESHNLDGIDVDLEWSHVDALYSPFVLELADSLHAKGFEISAAWPATTRYADITDAALASFDWINLMAYDLTGPWNPNRPGDHSPYSFANQGIAFWKGHGVSADRMNLGVPFYGRNWESPNTGQAFTYGSMVQEDTAYAYEDTVGQRYYNGIPGIQAKTHLAQMETSGIMIWEIGQDAFGVLEHLSLLKTIYEQIGQTTPLEPELAQLNAALFPNPFSEQISLEMNVEDRKSGIEIRDLQGRVLLEQRLDMGQNLKSWNLSFLPEGLYLFVIHTDGRSYIKKLIKR